MISIIPVQNSNFRTFGWIQDPSSFSSLCDVVAIFDCSSSKHAELVNSIIPKLVEERDGRDRLISAMSIRPLRLPYADLVGTSFMPRSTSRCNGIIQAAVKGQKRDFIGDWPADNFLRWAHAFGFVKYNYLDDTFEITESGLRLTNAKLSEFQISAEEKDILTTAILAYPPAIRILKLLSETEDTHMTKFELGKRLGFIGEDGFTSLPQNTLIRALAVTTTPKEKNTMKTDWEGSSDKYARMIAGWLKNLGLVSQIAKIVSVSIGNEKYTESIGQAYMITAQGITALNKSLGKSKHKRIAKNICFEMFATKGSDREYVRYRRSLILKFLSESKKAVNISQVIAFLSGRNMNENEATVSDDIKGFINIGLQIKQIDNQYFFDDLISDFVIPQPKKLSRSDFYQAKEELRSRISFLSHEYLSLIDLAYDSKQNRLFEMKTMELLTDGCGFEGLHLGGSRKPDGVIYTTNLTDNYGVIVDTKAYSGGYSLPISQADEMERYIGENQKRDNKINPNKWWDNFKEDITDYYFMFVSGSFKGNFAEQIKRISMSKGINGTAVTIANLLLCAEGLKNGSLTHKKLAKDMFCNGEYIY